MNSTTLNRHVVGSAVSRSHTVRTADIRPRTLEKEGSILKIHPDFVQHTKAVAEVLSGFETSGEMVTTSGRNVLKTVEIGGVRMFVKYFRRITLANRFVYRFFRASKAERSYEHALKLQQMDIATPQPIAYFEQRNGALLGNSYYIAIEQQDAVTLREVINSVNFPNREEILKQFTHFTFGLHEKGIEFRDHSSGNTLIAHNGDGAYGFSLVDVNRMQFQKTMWTERRMQNFDRITLKPDVLAIFAKEYARLSGEREEVLLELLLGYAKAKKAAYRSRNLRRNIASWFLV